MDRKTRDEWVERLRDLFGEVIPLKEQRTVCGRFYREATVELKKNIVVEENIDTQE